MSIVDQFAGTWRLVSYESQQPDGTIVFPFGPEVSGMLVYTPQGHMSGQAMRRVRSALPAPYRREANLGAVADAFESYIAYCGTWRVEEAVREVIHTVESSLYPNWVGTEQRRGYNFAGPLLMLTARLRKKEEWVVNRLVWRRAETLNS